MTIQRNKFIILYFYQLYTRYFTMKHFLTYFDNFHIKGSKQFHEESIKSIK